MREQRMIEEVMAQASEEKKRAVDLYAPVESLKAMVPAPSGSGSIALGLEIADIDKHIESAGGKGWFGTAFLTPTAHETLWRWLKIPGDYYMKLAKQHPDLLILNVNQALRDLRIEKGDKPVLLRLRQCQDGLELRGILKHTDRILDNLDLLRGVAPVVTDNGLSIHYDVYSDRCMKVAFRGPETNGGYRPGLICQNSELNMVQAGVECRLYKQICTNGMVVPVKGMGGKLHVGMSVEAVMIEIEEYARQVLSKGQAVADRVEGLRAVVSYPWMEDVDATEERTKVALRQLSKLGVRREEGKQFLAMYLQDEQSESAYKFVDVLTTLGRNMRRSGEEVRGAALEAIAGREAERISRVVGPVEIITPVPAAVEEDEVLGVPRELTDEEQKGE